jgi:hypothetical protein
MTTHVKIKTTAKQASALRKQAQATQATVVVVAAVVLFSFAQLRGCSGLA